jgi:hypothetical protein
MEQSGRKRAARWATLFVFLLGTLLVAFEVAKPAFAAWAHLAAPAHGSPPAPGFCAQSLRESMGFLCDSDQQWAARKDRVIYQQRQQEISSDDSCPRCFFTKNWEPNFSCIGQQRPGNPGDGGKWICDPATIARLHERHFNSPNQKCLIYSIGSSNMFGFEEAIHTMLPMCEIHIFDHTVNEPHPPSFAVFHKIGLGAYDRGDLLTLESIQARLGHTGIMIEVLKIDCEGCEFDAIFPNDFKRVRQLLVEIHGFGDINTQSIHRFFNRMFLSGWVIFSKEVNAQWCLGQCLEYSLLQLSWNTADLDKRARRNWCIGGWQSSAPTVPENAYVPENMARCSEWGQG